METAETVILDAMQLLGIQASESALESDEVQTVIRQMNRLMARYDAEGISLGYTEVTKLASPITIPLGAVDGLVTNLAIAIAPHFLNPGELPPELVALGISGKQAMRNLAVTAGTMAYPSTLPVGGANEWPGWSNRHFYPETQEQIDSESNQNIVVEDNTEVS